MDFEDLALKEIRERGWMTVRAADVCEKNGVKFLSQLLAIYKHTGGFVQWGKCGIRTKNELATICEKYLSPLRDSEPLSGSHDTIIESVNQLSPFKKQILDRYLLNEFDNLGVRAKNGLVSIVGESITGKTILTNIILKDVNFINIRNIGKGTLSSLLSFKSKSIRFIDRLSKANEIFLNQEYLKLICEFHYNKSGQLLENNIKSVINEVNKIKIFKVFDLLVAHGHIFKPKPTRIFNINYKVHLDKKPSMESIANGMGIGKERVRQIEMGLVDEIKNNTSFILSLRPEDLNNYALSNEMDLMTITPSWAAEISESEDVNYNYLFYSIFFGELFKRSHTTIGLGKVIGQNKYTRAVTMFKNSYIISLPVYNSLNWNAIIGDIFDKWTEKIVETYSLYFEDYLKDFVTTFDKELFARARNICEQIIYYEFNLVVNPDGFLVFARNKRKLNHEYIEQILEENKRLMTVGEIFKEICVNYAEVATTEGSVRASLITAKEKFFYIGRTSTYGLRKWENEQDNLKGGTIRDIAEEFLQQYDQPMHISDIAKYVGKYRNTTEANILHNFLLEGANRRFIVYKGRFVGLLSKSYSRESGPS